MLYCFNIVYKIYTCYNITFLTLGALTFIREGGKRDVSITVPTIYIGLLNLHPTALFPVAPSMNQ